MKKKRKKRKSKLVTMPNGVTQMPSSMPVSETIEVLLGEETYLTTQNAKEIGQSTLRSVAREIDDLAADVAGTLQKVKAGDLPIDRAIMSWNYFDEVLWDLLGKKGHQA